LIKEFEVFREQLELGRIIHVEISPDNIVDFALLQYEINYDDKSLKMTISNRLKLHSDFTTLGDIQSQVTQSTNEITFSKDNWGYAMKSGILDDFDSYMKSALNIANNPLIATTGQKAVFDDNGYHGFRWNSNTGTYDPEQMQIVNNQIRFTKDNWNSIACAFGKIKLPNGTYVYGMNGDAMVAGKIISPTNPYVYFDLNNGVLAASKLVSSTEGATDVYANIGTVTWSNASPSKGLALYSSDGLICYLDQIDKDDLGYVGLEITSRGKIQLRCSAYGQDNSLVLFNDSNSQGNIQMWRRSNETTSEEVFNAYNGETDIYGRNIVWLHTNTGTMSFRLKSDGFHFAAGGLERALIDSQGYKGWINGYEGIDGDIVDKNGDTWTFRGGILVG
jgi:hypothetical protein